jgi:hypothetical protein
LKAFLAWGVIVCGCNVLLSCERRKRVVAGNVCNALSNGYDAAGFVIMCRAMVRQENKS